MTNPLIILCFIVGAFILLLTVSLLAIFLTWTVWDWFMTQLGRYIFHAKVRAENTKYKGPAV